MTLLTENNGWAIIWMNDKYYLRHLSCGAYLRSKYATQIGCFCQKQGGIRIPPESVAAPVDALILNKFKLITKGDK